MSDELKPCPFCGSKSIKITARDYLFGGWTGIGISRRKYRVRVICNHCHSTGRPISTDWKTRDIHNFLRSGIDTDNFTPYVEAAVEAWNTRC